MPEINEQLFDHFGKVTFQTSKLYNCSNIIADVTNSEDKYSYFEEMCKGILEESLADYNSLVFHNLVYQLTNENPNKVNNIIIESFNLVTEKIKNSLSDLIVGDDFTVQKFMDIYNNFISKSNEFSKYMMVFNNIIVKQNQIKQYPHINLIRNYLFYKNVINIKYNYKGKYMYLYEFLTEQIEKGSTEFNLIVSLLKMYTFYVRLSYVAKEAREQLFNIELEKMFLTTLGDNQPFIKLLINYINKSIDLCLDKNKKEIILKNLIELLDFISTYFKERDMFNMHYEDNLELRLLKVNCDTELEKHLLYKFKRPDDNKVIQRMIYKIEDVESGKNLEILKKKTKISLTTLEYKGKINLDEIQLTNVSPMILRYSAWNNSRTLDIQQIEPPIEMKAYMNILSKLYQSRYSRRELKWNLNMGEGVVKVNLGGKNYSLRVTTPQLALLLQFNQKDKISAKELSENMKYPLSKLAIIINSFLMVQILEKDDKQNNDPNLLFSLNNKFHYDSEKISLVNIIMTLEQQYKQNCNKVDKEISDKFAIGRENILQGAIIRAVKQNTNMTNQSLLENIKSKIPFDITDNLYKSVLKTCFHEKYIKMKDTGEYEYILASDSDDDEEVDS